MAPIVRMPGKEKAIHQYWAYGVGIESEVRLDDLTPIVGRPSSTPVRIVFGKLPDSKFSHRFRGWERFESPGQVVMVSETSMYVEWDRVGRFLVTLGSEIIVDPEPDVTDNDLEPFITGPVLSVLLHQRGLFVLHSSSVTIGEKAIVFLGSKGYGKSTLAALLQLRGHQLISDDLVPISFVGDRATTFPGYPRIKLNEDSIIASGNRPETFPLVHRLAEKRSFRPTTGISRQPLELIAVYILAESTGISLEDLNPSAAFIELTKHSFLRKFLSAMNARREHFHQCERLVRTVPVVRLNRPHDFALMDEVCRQVEDHAGTLGRDGRSGTGNLQS